jgi:hypothetical protein
VVEPEEPKSRSLRECHANTRNLPPIEQTFTHSHESRLGAAAGHTCISADRPELLQCETPSPQHFDANHSTCPASSSQLGKYVSSLQASALPFIAPAGMEEISALALT